MTTEFEKRAAEAEKIEQHETITTSPFLSTFIFQPMAGRRSGAKRNAKKGVQFTLMVVGSCYLIFLGLEDSVF